MIKKTKYSVSTFYAVLVQQLTSPKFKIKFSLMKIYNFLSNIDKAHYLVSVPLMKML